MSLSGSISLLVISATTASASNLKGTDSSCRERVKAHEGTEGGGREHAESHVRIPGLERITHRVVAASIPFPIKINPPPQYPLSPRIRKIHCDGLLFLEFLLENTKINKRYGNQVFIWGKTFLRPVMYFTTSLNFSDRKGKPNQQFIESVFTLVPTN